MNKNTDKLDFIKSHALDTGIMSHEIWVNSDGRIYSYYDIGSSLDKAYNMPSTIYALYNDVSSSVEIVDSVVRDQGIGVGSRILGDFIGYCKSKNYSKIKITISPVDKMDILVDFYKKFGFDNFNETDGHIKANLSLN